VLQHKKAMGEVYSPTPYGFDRVGKMLVVNHTEQAVLEEILSMRAQGRSMRSIADALNREGIPAKHGGKWFGATVRSVIKTSGVV